MNISKRSLGTGTGSNCSTGGRSVPVPVADVVPVPVVFESRRVIPVKRETVKESCLFFSRIFMLSESLLILLFTVI